MQHNKALHWTGVPLRFTPASELCRYVPTTESALITRVQGTLLIKVKNDCDDRNNQFY